MCPPNDVVCYPLLERYLVVGSLGVLRGILKLKPAYKFLAILKNKLLRLKSAIQEPKYYSLTLSPS